MTGFRGSRGHFNKTQLWSVTKTFTNYTLEVQPQFLKGWFPNHHDFRGLSFSKRNHHFLKWWLTSRVYCSLTCFLGILIDISWTRSECKNGQILGMLVWQASSDVKEKPLGSHTLGGKKYIMRSHVSCILLGGSCNPYFWGLEPCFVSNGIYIYINIRISSGCLFYTGDYEVVYRMGILVTYSKRPSLLGPSVIGRKTKMDLGMSFRSFLGG